MAIIEQPLADDFIHLTAILLHRRDRLRVSVVMLGKIFDQRSQLARSVEIDIILELGDDDASAGARGRRTREG